MKDTQIYIATHKFFLPPNKLIYKPIVAGADFSSLPYLKDNTGDNISSKNLYYSELTALYWIWKHNQSKYVGLVHYHRYFKKNEHFLSKNEIHNILTEYDVIVPQPLYFPCSVLEQYQSVHYENDLLLACEKLERQKYNYIDAIEYVLNSNQLYPCNMFVSSNDFLKDYASFLFPILFELEKEIPYLSYSIYNRRVFGFLAERIFNIYLRKNHYKVYEYPTVDTHSLIKQKRLQMNTLKLLAKEKSIK